VRGPYEGTQVMVAESGAVSVRGEIDRNTICQVVEAIETIGETVVVVDLGGVSFLDSSGLQGILFVQQAARRRGGDVILRYPSHVVSRVLDFAGLGEAFVIVDE
jgi:anti-anti-sigma factor